MSVECVSWKRHRWRFTLFIVAWCCPRLPLILYYFSFSTSSSPLVVVVSSLQLTNLFTIIVPHAAMYLHSSCIERFFSSGFLCPRTIGSRLVFLDFGFLFKCYLWSNIFRFVVCLQSGVWHFSVGVNSSRSIINTFLVLAIGFYELLPVFLLTLRVGTESFGSLIPLFLLWSYHYCPSEPSRSYYSFMILEFWWSVGRLSLNFSSFIVPSNLGIKSWHIVSICQKAPLTGTDFWRIPILTRPSNL